MAGTLSHSVSQGDVTRLNRQLKALTSQLEALSEKPQVSLADVLLGVNFKATN